MNPFLTEAFAESLLDQSLTGVTERGGWLGSFVAKRLVTVTASSLLEMPGPYADALARLKATRGGEGPEPRDTDEGRAQGYSWVDRGGVMPVVLVAWLTYLSWPAVHGTARLLRAATLGLVALAGVLRLVGD